MQLYEAFHVAEGSRVLKPKSNGVLSNRIEGTDIKKIYISILKEQIKVEFLLQLTLQKDYSI